MKRIALATLIACLCTSGVRALSLDVDTDKATYLVGETLTVTATLDTTDAPAGQVVVVSLNWDPTKLVALNATPTFTLGTSSQLVTSGVNAGASNLTSGGGGIPWSGPAQSRCALIGPTAGNTCILLNQVSFVSLVPDPAILVGTLELQVIGVGSPGLNLARVDAFGATPHLGPNFVPEPATAALLGLGLLGLAASRRR